MDEEYLQQLLAAIQAQYAMEGGGLMEGMGDPLAPSGGFPSPPMPNGKMPQYRTQGSGYVSDGTVRDMLGKVLVNNDEFSADALFSVDPALKPIISRAVAEGGHDPYNTYALLDDPSYQKALYDRAMAAEGLPEFTPNLEGVTDTNMDTVVDVNDLSYDDYKAQGDASIAGQRKTQDTGMRNMYGDAVNTKHLYSDLLEQRLGTFRGALDDFVTQAAPSTQRNKNNLDAMWAESGGMPYLGQGGGGMDYAGTGTAFPGGGGAGGAVPAGNDPAMGEFMEQYLRDHGVDIEGNKRRRDAKKAAINTGTRKAAQNKPAATAARAGASRNNTAPQPSRATRRSGPTRDRQGNTQTASAGRSGSTRNSRNR